MMTLPDTGRGCATGSMCGCAIMLVTLVWILVMCGLIARAI
jgi:hypothetical protein